MKESEALTERARALISAGKKDRAMLALKIKKLKTQKCDEANNQLIQLQTMVTGIVLVLEKANDNTTYLHKPSR